MKALMKLTNHSGDLGLLDIEEPVCGDSEVKVDVKACSVCGTDIHIMHGLYPWGESVVLGHEYSGIVVEVGSKVKKFKVGDRITGSGSGGYAKYLTVNENDFVFSLPENISFEEGAFFEPLSACTHAVLDHSGIMPTDIVLVSGPGSIGLCAMQIAKVSGAVVIVAGTSVDKNRLALAKQLGADYVVNVQETNLEKYVMDLTGGRYLDDVLECSGSQSALTSGLKLLKREGTFTQIGLFTKPVELDLDSIVYRQIKFENSIGFVKSSWVRSIELVRTGKVNVKSLISHKLPLADWRRGFEVCENKEGLKVVIIP